MCQNFISWTYFLDSNFESNQLSMKKKLNKGGYVTFASQKSLKIMKDKDKILLYICLLIITI